MSPHAMSAGPIRSRPVPPQGELLPTFQYVLRWADQTHGFTSVFSEALKSDTFRVTSVNP